MERFKNSKIKFFLGRLLFVFVLIGVPTSWAVTPLSSEATAQEWISHMAKAVRQLSYQGRSILLNGDQLNSVELIHGVVDGERWERIIHLTGAPSEILRRGKQISCLHPESSKDFHASSSPLQTLVHSEDFKVPANYMLRKGGSGRVAGRDVYRVDVLPKDKARYGYQFWLDKASGLLLKSVTVDRKGRGLEVFEFVSIDVGKTIDPSAFNPGEGLKWISKKEHHNSQAPQLNWQLSWLPSGFNLSKSEMRVVDGVEASTKVFTDGLAAFSVFLEKIDSRIQSEGTQTHGATTALSRRLPVNSGEYLVTVVGEIPMETAMQVAMAVRLGEISP